MKGLLKRVLTIALVFALAVPATVISVSADPGDAVTMTQGETTKNYPSINAAIADTQKYDYKANKTQYVITLLQDTNEDVVIPAGRSIKIDLAGHTLTNVSDHTIYNNSTRIYITDSSADKSGVVDNITHGKGAVYNNINATIYLEGGTFMRSREASKDESTSGENSWYVLKNFGSMTIKKGVTVKFSDRNAGMYSSLIGNGWQNASAAESGTNGEPKPSEGNNKASLTISGGMLSGGQITVKNDDYGVLTISGGQIIQPSAGRAAVANNNEATIKGGTIEAVGKGGKAVYSRHFSGDANKGKLTISGGSFKSTGTVIDSQAGTTLTVSGGSFETTSSDSYIMTVDRSATAEIKNGTYKCADTKHVSNNSTAFAEGYAPQTDKDGNITVGITDKATEAIVTDLEENETKYLTLSSAMSNAPAGSTVKLMKNVTLSKTASTINYGVTVDLNGFNVDGSAVKKGSSVLKLNTNYGSKPLENGDNALRLINSKQTGGVVKGILPVEANCGNSMNPLAVEIADSVTLEATGDSGAVKLSSSAYMLYSEKSAAYIGNGGFKVTDEEGQDRIYGRYANAVKYAADGVVTLMNDYTGSDQIISGSSSCTLDLNSHTYTYTGTGEIVDVNYPDVTLTIKNGSLTATSPESDGIVMVGASDQKNNRGIVLENVTVTVPGETYGIATNGTETGNSIVMRNSTLNVKNGFGIYFPSTGSVVIEDSVINAKHVGVQMCAGSLEISGDKTKITVSGEPQKKTDGDGPIADGAAVSIIEREGYGKLGTVTVADGTFVSATDVEAIKTYKFNNKDKESAWEDAGDVVSVSGGNFSTEVPQEICAEQFIPTEKDPQTGMFTVVKDVAAPLLSNADTDLALADGGIYYGGELKFTVADMKLASVKANGTELTADANGVYTLSAGDYTITAEDAAGNKTELKLTVKAAKGQITTETAQITLAGQLTENGQEQTQKVTVVVDGVTLTEGVDYTLTGNKATLAGDYMLTVTGMGNYEGSVNVAYTIAEKPAVTDPDTPAEPGAGEKPSGGEPEKTGDVNDIMPWLALLALTGAALAGTARLKRSKEK